MSARSQTHPAYVKLMEEVDAYLNLFKRAERMIGMKAKIEAIYQSSDWQAARAAWDFLKDHAEWVGGEDDFPLRTLIERAREELKGSPYGEQAYGPKGALAQTYIVGGYAAARLTLYHMLDQYGQWQAGMDAG